METKKDPGRFTLHFNLHDPLQKAAVDILNHQGRQKAQFIARALKQYVDHPMAPNTQGGDIPDERTLEQAIISVLRKYPNLVTDRCRIEPPSDGSGKLQEVEQADTVEAPETFSQECFSAIQKTLASFCGK